MYLRSLAFILDRHKVVGGNRRNTDEVREFLQSVAACDRGQMLQIKRQIVCNSLRIRILIPHEDGPTSGDRQKNVSHR